jgi:hypothetical protein
MFASLLVFKVLSLHILKLGLKFFLPFLLVPGFLPVD